MVVERIKALIVAHQAAVGRFLIFKVLRDFTFQMLVLLVNHVAQRLSLVVGVLYIAREVRIAVLGLGTSLSFLVGPTHVSKLCFLKHVVLRANDLRGCVLLPLSERTDFYAAFFFEYGLIVMIDSPGGDGVAFCLHYYLGFFGFIGLGVEMIVKLADWTAIFGFHN